MVNILDVKAEKLIKATASKLKSEKIVNPPAWLTFVKSASYKERLPEEEDFWYIRCASILRKIAIKGPIGVSNLREEYSGRKHRGSKPEKYAKSGGSIIRKALQQLEKAGLIEKKTKGRVLTKKGVLYLNSIVKELK